MSFALRRYKLIAFCLLSLFAGVYLLQRSQNADAAPCGTVAAITNVFPRPSTGLRETAGCGGADSYMWLSEYHAGSPLTTRNAKLRVFYSTADLAVWGWDIDFLSFETLNNGNHRCGSNISITVAGSTQWLSKPGGTCVISYPPGFTINQGMLSADVGRYGNGWRYVDIDMFQWTNDSNAPVRARAWNANARITFHEQSIGEAQTGGNYNVDGSFGAFALWSADMGGGTQEPLTYTLKFSPDCSVAPNAPINVSLKWYDADDDNSVGGTNAQHPFRMELYDDTTGTYVIDTYSNNPFFEFGNDDAYVTHPPVTLYGGHRYRWIWSNISRNNGVQIFMPFSEINAETTCVPPDVCANIPGNQASVPAGMFQSGPNCYVNDAQPSMWAGPDCANNRVSVWSTDPNGNGYNIFASINGGGWFPVGRDGSGWFFVGMGANGRYSAVTVSIVTWGTNPPYMAPGSAQSNSTSVTFGPCYTQVRGRVHNAYSRATGYAGVTINTCQAGISATTNGNGDYVFDAPIGGWYCVRVNGQPAGSYTTNVRPWGEGYPGCGAYGPGVASPDYCAAQSTYECQIAGTNAGINCSGIDYDRGADTGFDFALRYRPVITCALTSPSVIEVSQPYRPTVDVRNTQPSTRPPVSGSVTLIVTGQPNRSTAYGPLTAGQDTNPDVTFTDVIITTPGTYNVSARATGVGDGISIDPTPFTCNGSTTVLVSQMSYLKSYGGDVWAGASFQNPCVFTTGSIDAFATPRGTSPINGAPMYAGSSAQFSVTALMTINEFYSVSNRVPGGGNTFPPKGLTFSNNGAGAPSSTYGGGYGNAYPRCLPDYYNDTRGGSVQTVAGVTNANFGTAGPLQFDLGAGDHTIGSLTIPNGRQVVIFAEGNVYLNGNIQYDGAARATIADIPNLTLITRGNIFVDNNVTRLDGLYIAQPAGGAAATQGRFYTCARQLTPPRLYTSTEIFANCGGQAGVSGQLVVNGGVIAQQIRFLRTFGTLRDAAPNEVPNFATGAGTQAGEVFNYTAEMFLAPSGLERPRQSGSYDAITSLPPIY